MGVPRCAKRALGLRSLPPMAPHDKPIPALPTALSNLLALALG